MSVVETNACPSAYYCDPEKCCSTEWLGRRASFDRSTVQYLHQYHVCGIYIQSNTIVCVLLLQENIRVLMSAETCTSTGLRGRPCTFPIAFFYGESFASVWVSDRICLPEADSSIGFKYRIGTEVGSCI